MPHQHMHQPSVTASLNNGEVKLDFSAMPLSRLTNLRQLGIDGNTVTRCINWVEAATAAVDALARSFGERVSRVVYDRDYRITIVAAPDENIDQLFNDVVEFIQRKIPNIKDLRGPQPRSAAMH